jgi:hypothetical protein
MSRSRRRRRIRLLPVRATARAADRSYLDEGARLLEIAQGARRLFAKQQPSGQRRLLNFVLSNSTSKDTDLPAIV